MLSNRSTTQKNQNWATDQLVQLSQFLSEGYNPAFAATTSSKKDIWTTDKYIAMSKYLGSAYGVDV